VSWSLWRPVASTDLLGLVFQHLKVGAAEVVERPPGRERWLRELRGEELDVWSDGPGLFAPEHLTHAQDARFWASAGAVARETVPTTTRASKRGVMFMTPPAA